MEIRKLAPAVALAALAVASGPRSAMAQQLRGRVVDSAGVVVARAQVLVYPESLTATADDSGRFSLGPLPSGRHVLRVRRIGYAQVVRELVTPAPGDTITVTMAPTPVMLEAVRTSALEQRLPRVLFRANEHLGAVLYGARLDSLLHKEPGETVEELLPWDRRAALKLMAARGRCRVYTFVDGVQTHAPIAFYVEEDQIAAIEVYDSADFIHEPFIGIPFIDDSSHKVVRCAGLILIWSKHYQQLPWAGH